MKFIPIDRMWERIETAKEDSDSLAFMTLLYCGEAMTKTIVAGLAAAVKDDRERHRYRLLYALVRANSLGEWVQSLNEILAGPTSQLLSSAARDEQRELTQKHSSGSWQYDAVRLLCECRTEIGDDYDLPIKVAAKDWFTQFVAIRNRTRGHGAFTGQDCSKACPKIEQAIRLVSENLVLFRRPWAYLHQNLSGKYRVARISSECEPFDYFKSTRGQKLANGVYVYFDDPCRVDLMVSDPDVSDFLFPNGSFTDKRFELISYATDDRAYAESQPYLQPPTELPPSETQGIGSLDIRGRVFTNLPPVPTGYVSREALEKELCAVLIDERHPVVTLVGRGGIGKTWLSLYVLDKVAQSQSFDCVVWFSSRDIDLLPHGPKLVKPHILTTQDIADEFSRLTGWKAAGDSHSKPLDFLRESLGRSSFGPTLFVFDNFETVENPVELYRWLDTYIRLPNKVLITTRAREAKGDYPVEVAGMTDREFEELVAKTAAFLDVQSLITDDYKKQLFEESAGHPYVVKMLLGELAKDRKSKNVRRILATRNDILDALFDRTYAALSLAAQRVFLTLCDWRSTIPQLALEGVLLRPENVDRIDVEQAISELRQSSFIEVSSEAGGTFINVPLAAFQFGRGKLEVTPLKASIQADTEILQLFGAAQPEDTKRGLEPRIRRMFDEVARRASRDKAMLERYLPVLEFIARGFPRAWFILASLHEELNDCDSAKKAIRRYLETALSGSDSSFAWDRLANLCQKTKDWSGEVHARIERARLPGTPFNLISNTANRLNELFRDEPGLYDSEEKRIIVQSLVDTMASRIDEANAVDFSRLAWLCLHLQDEMRAKQFTVQGLGHDLQNAYCRRLAEKLHITM